jgi:pimeloyl-ACP methyl ester carboxylesterase
MTSSFPESRLFRCAKRSPLIPSKCLEHIGSGLSRRIHCGPSWHNSSKTQQSGLTTSRTRTGKAVLVIDQLRLAFEDENLAAVLTVPVGGADRVALLLHGGPGGVKEGPSELYVRLADALAERGIASCRFDLMGAGESTGDYAFTSPQHQVEQCVFVAEWLRLQRFTKLAVVGESFGGTCALGAYDKVRPSALVLLWPAVWLFDATFDPLIPDDWASRELIDIDGTVVRRQFVEGLHAVGDRETELCAVSVPTLLVHGEADLEVPVDQSRRAFDLLREPKRIVTVPGAAHCLRRLEEQARAISETVDWLDVHLA